MKHRFSKLNRADEPKIHYRLRKHHKRWLTTALISTTAIGIVSLGNATTVNADTNRLTSTQQNQNSSSSDTKLTSSASSNEPELSATSDQAQTASSTASTPVTDSSQVITKSTASAVPASANSTTNNSQASAASSSQSSATAATSVVEQPTATSTTAIDNDPSWTSVADNHQTSVSASHYDSTNQTIYTDSQLKLNFNNTDSVHYVVITDRTTGQILDTDVSSNSEIILNKLTSEKILQAALVHPVSIWTGSWFNLTNTSIITIGPNQSVQVSEPSARLTLIYLDDDANQVQVGQVQEINGAIDSQVNWHVNDTDLPSGYQLAGTQQSHGTVQLDTSQTIYIHLTHLHTQSTVTTNVLINQTNDQGLSSNTIQPISWIKDTDLVTNITVYFPVNREIKVPINATKDDQVTISSGNLTGMKYRLSYNHKFIQFKLNKVVTQVPTSLSLHVKITAPTYTTTITVIDTESNGHPVVYQQTIQGAKDTTGTYNLLQNVDLSNYQVIFGSPALSGSITFTAEQGILKIYVTHQHQILTPEQSNLTSTRVIDVVSNGHHQQVTQTIFWGIDTDLVTGKTEYLPYSDIDGIHLSQGFPEYTVDTGQENVTTSRAEELVTSVDENHQSITTVPAVDALTLAAEIQHDQPDLSSGSNEPIQQASTLPNQTNSATSNQNTNNDSVSRSTRPTFTNTDQVTTSVTNRQFTTQLNLQKVRLHSIKHKNDSQSPTQIVPSHNQTPVMPGGNDHTQLGMYFTSLAGKINFGVRS